MPSKLLIYTDGACSGNGTSKGTIAGSYAAYAVDPDTNWRGTRAENEHMLLAEAEPVEFRHKVTLPVSEMERPTNNLAEAKTLEMALAWLKQYIKENTDYKEVEICMDSQLVMYQLQGIYATNSPPLRRVYGRILKLLDALEARGVKYSFTWIPGVLMKKTRIAH